MPIKAETYKFNFSDYENFCELISDKFQIEISNFSFTIFKRRIEHFFEQFSVKKYSEIVALLKNKKFWKIFQQVFLVPTTEMFRDPEMWVLIRDVYLPKLLSNRDNLQIFIPDVTTDDELFSTIVMLNNLNINQQVSIVASSQFENIKDYISIQQISEKKFKTSIENYNKFCDKNDFEKFFDQNKKNYHFKNDYLENIKFKKINLCEESEIIQQFDMIIFRNRMLYYKPACQYKILDNLDKLLKNKSYLIIGAMEQFASWQHQNRYNKVEKNCNIFLKKR
jgi:chemotaxis protein methyltransferase CheR